MEEGQLGRRSAWKQVSLELIEWVWNQAGLEG